MPEWELLRWHCKGKAAHTPKKAHAAHGCTKAKPKKHPRKRR